MVMTSSKAVERSLRGARAAWVLLAAGTPWLAASCASRSNDLAMPGASDRPMEAPKRAPAAPAHSSETWDQAAEVPTFALIDDRQLPSRGHNPPYWSGEVRANAALAPIYRTIGPDSAGIPEGGVVVEAHRAADGAPGPTFAMVKRAAGFDAPGGDWEFLVIRGDGMVESRGVLPLCARCHADAPYDHLFGPRVSSRRRIVGSGGGGETDAGPLGADEDEARAPADGEMPGSTKQGAKPGRKKRSR